ncbi:hypothetical protein Tco_0373594 [Tanacetum coccineum]
MSTANQQTLAKTGTPNDIYNYVDACEDAQGMWQHVKRLMQGTDLSQQERHSRLMNEFDKFSDEADESLKSVYESKDHFNKLYDYLSQCEPHVNASRVKKNARNHDPLALVVNSYANPSYSHASPSYSQSPQPYYPTMSLIHPFVHENEDDYQGDIQVFSMEHDAALHKNKKLKFNLETEENDFMLMNAYGNDQVEDLNASMIMMARIQRTNNKSDAELTYDAEVISKEFETIKHTSVDDQIDSDIIFNDPYVEDNSIQAEHDQDAHDQSFAGLKSLFIMYK